MKNIVSGGRNLGKVGKFRAFETDQGWRSYCESIDRDGKMKLHFGDYTTKEGAKEACRNSAREHLAEIYLAEDEGVYLASHQCEVCGKMYDRTEPGADNESSMFICAECNQ